MEEGGTCARLASGFFYGLVMRTRMNPPRLLVLSAWFCAFGCGGATKSSTTALSPCPPCPEGYHCAADVMVRDLKSGRIVCFPSYCVAGPDPICEVDPGACKPRPTKP